MACPDSEVLARYLSEEAAPREAEDVRLHAGGCPACRDHIEANRALDRVLGQLELPGAGVEPRACLDAMTLAALLDGGLPEGDRSQAVAHLAGCGSCLDALVSSVQRTIPSAPVPDRLADEARALGREPRRTAVRSPRAALSRPLWQLAAALGAVVVAGSVLWPPAPAPPAPSTAPSTNAPFDVTGLTGKGGFTPQPPSARSDLQAGGIVRVDAALLRALRRYGAEPTAEARGDLLRALEEGPLRIPADRVDGITLLERVASGSLAEVRVQLLKDGRLVIEEP